MAPRIDRGLIAARLGNAGGVDIFFNGQALPSTGPLDKARTLSFTPAGLER